MSHTSTRRHVRALPAVAVLAAVVLAASCGGDDDDTTAATIAAPSTTIAPTNESTADETTTTPATTEAPAATEAPTTTEAASAATTASGDGETGPSGTVVMTVGDTTIEADIVECTVVEPDVQFRAEGETSQIEVYAIGDDETGVIVSGAYEYEGKGTAAFNPDTSGIDQGEIMVTGSGSQPDDSTPIEDFTVDARIDSC